MSAKNQRITKKGFRYEILPSTEYSPRRVKDYNEYCTLYNRLAELEDKIENGTLVEPPCCNKNIKFYFNGKEIPFEKLSEIPQRVVDRVSHTRTEIVLHYIGKDAIYFYTKTGHYTVADGTDEEYYEEM